MQTTQPNRLTQSLADILEELPITEKWLLAPSKRVGFQWLDTVTRLGGHVLNVHVKTFQGMAIELAAPEMAGAGTNFVSGWRSRIMVDRLFRRVSGKSDGYFAHLQPTPRLVDSVHRTLRELRLGGLTAEDLPSRRFEVPRKGEDIRELLRALEEELTAANAVDTAGILRIAAARLREYPLLVAEKVLVLLPQSMEKALHALERNLWNAVPQNRIRVLREDSPDDPAEEDAPDSRLLRFVLDPPAAPRPRMDSTARIIRAVGEVNEVREVMRECMELGIPLDEAEILYSDKETYLPLIYEVASGMTGEKGEPVGVTFAEGVPLRYSRPGRALMAWLSWNNDDHPQSTLVRMIQDGLLHVEARDDERVSWSRLAAVLRSIPIGGRLERYLTVVGREIEAAQSQEGSRSSVKEEIEDHETGSPRASAARLSALLMLDSLVRDLHDHVIRPQEGPLTVLERITWFLTHRVRSASRFDEYSKGRLLKEIKELTDSLDPSDDLDHLDVVSWVQDLVASEAVGGLGPRPCCLYVAPLSGGGHSGRAHTFILGLDDSRFPGSGLQDPLLLDLERKSISPDLSTAAARTTEKVHDLARLFARLRGTVTLSYCCKSLADDRELFPTPALLSAFRIVYGLPEGDHDALVKELRGPASFAPSGESRCTDMSEWWLMRLCSGDSIENSEAILSEAFPRLGRGMVAKRERESNRFTEYDGHVPQAASEWDFTGTAGRALSSSQLEKLGTCPLEFFFRYVLKIERPKELAIDPSLWLESHEKGSLLHKVFRRFMASVRRAGNLPDVRRDAELLEQILNEEIARARDSIPPHNEQVFQLTVRELRLAARIFLEEEAVFCTSNVPTYFEASIGLPRQEEPTALDSTQPVTIALAKDLAIKVRGRVDRIDEVAHSNGRLFAIWDYKTGWAGRYDRRDPFKQGRLVQSVLYLEMVRKRLGEVLSGSPSVQSFGYFFPTTVEHGERIVWPADRLEEGRILVKSLVEMLASGCFPFTDKVDDAKYSDYAAAFGDVETMAAAMKTKIENPDNLALAPFRRLRGQA